MPQQNNLPQLDERLMAAASYVRKGTTVADIGCDHGKLSIYLASNGICSKVIACDINEKPLERAKHNVAIHGLDEKIECRLGNGLAIVDANEAQDIVIAGMSGVTISDIISDAPLFHTAGRRFILVPASKPEVLRKYLCENGFEIKSETPTMVSGYCYAVICAEYTGTVTHPTPLFCIMGYCNNGTPASKRYFFKVLRRLEKQGDTALATEVKQCLL